MDGATLGLGLAAVVAIRLIWWGLHSSRMDSDLIDQAADEAFRRRVGG